MTFRTLELSPYSGQPLQLYEFSRASGDGTFFWRYNGSDRDITYDSGLFNDQVRCEATNVGASDRYDLGFRFNIN